MLSDMNYAWDILRLKNLQPSGYFLQAINVHFTTSPWMNYFHPWLNFPCYLLKDVLEETGESFKVPMVKPNTYKHIKAGSMSFRFGHRLLVTPLHMQIRKIQHLIKSIRFILRYRKIFFFFFFSCFKRGQNITTLEKRCVDKPMGMSLLPSTLT